MKALTVILAVLLTTLTAFAGLTSSPVKALKLKGDMNANGYSLNMVDDLVFGDAVMLRTWMAGSDAAQAQFQIDLDAISDPGAANSSDIAALQAQVVYWDDAYAWGDHSADVISLQAQIDAWDATGGVIAPGTVAEAHLDPALTTKVNGAIQDTDPASSTTRVGGISYVDLVSTANGATLRWSGSGGGDLIFPANAYIELQGSTLDSPKDPISDAMVGDRGYNDLRYATLAQGALAATANGWGDHALAGYLTAQSSESDPVWTAVAASVWAGIGNSVQSGDAANLQNLTISGLGTSDTITFSDQGAIRWFDNGIFQIETDTEDLFGGKAGAGIWSEFATYYNGNSILNSDSMDTRYASSAQGVLADTAIQNSGDAHLNELSLAADAGMQLGPYQFKAGTGGPGDAFTIETAVGGDVQFSLRAGVNIQAPYANYYDGDSLLKASVMDLRYGTYAQGLLADTAVQAGTVAGSLVLDRGGSIDILTPVSMYLSAGEVDLLDSPLRNPKDPTTAAGVGDRGYNDARYARVGDLGFGPGLITTTGDLGPAANFQALVDAVTLANAVDHPTTIALGAGTYAITADLMVRNIYGHAIHIVGPECKPVTTRLEVGCHPNWSPPAVELDGGGGPTKYTLTLVQQVAGLQAGGSLRRVHLSNHMRVIDTTESAPDRGGVLFEDIVVDTTAAIGDVVNTYAMYNRINVRTTADPCLTGASGAANTIMTDCAIDAEGSAINMASASGFQAIHCSGNNPAAPLFPSTIGGILIGCYSSNSGFGSLSGAHIASTARLTDCVAGNQSYGYNGEIEAGAVLTRCSGDAYAFAYYGNINGTLVDCTAELRAFAFGGVVGATADFLRCIGGPESFGETSVAGSKHTDCEAGPASYAIEGASGSYLRCMAYGDGFGSDAVGVFAGTARFCVATGVFGSTVTENTGSSFFCIGAPTSAFNATDLATRGCIIE